MGPGYVLLGMSFRVLSILYYAHQPPKMTNLKFGTEFWAVAGPLIAVRPPKRPTDALELRATVNAGLSVVLRHALPDGVVEETKHHVKSFDGETIALHKFAPEADGTDGKQPALIYFLTWTDNSKQVGWNAYLGVGKAGGPETAAYAAPARAVDVANLPSTYIEVGGVYLFCAGAVAFASRLASANVQMELHVYPGLPHIFDFTRICNI
ncbi:hypothetical protein LZ31DRAFT_601342 [Colletotrichum somersetense]|nr:hypothetical protein LZ31DRAFT_601342 [Colletotrichum somersetense]